MPKSQEIVIVGAGVIGSSIAYHLARKGMPSRIIERESIGARASGKAWGVITYPPVLLVAEKTPGSDWSLPDGETYADWLDLFWLGYRRMSDLAFDIQEKGGVDIDYAETRSTVLLASGQPEEAIRDGVMSVFRENGAYECEWFGRDALREEFGTIGGRIVGGISRPESQVEPYKYTLGLAQAAEHLGAEVTQGEVVGFGADGVKITSVKLASGAEIRADVVVIAMGPWTTRATSWLGREIPSELLMEECLRVEGPEGWPLHSVSYGPSTIVPLITGDIILAGGGDEKSIRERRDDSYDLLSDEVRARILERAVQVLPGLEDAKLIEHRGDLLAHTPGLNRHKPVMGRLPDWENGYVATNFGGMGICLSPGVGQIMADLISDGDVPIRARSLMEVLSPARL
jgi:glycine/D-amino acid oxidase-like deaminating enzyme